jgi:putative transposase
MRLGRSLLAAAVSVGQFMQDLGRRYVRYVNSQYQRTGTLWEGRYRTGYIQDVPYVLHAYVWLDGMSEHSSRAQHLGHYAHSFLREHAQYWQLGNTPFARERAYADLVAAGLAPTIRQAIAGAAHSGWALGSDAFIADLQRRTERRVVKAAAGRPVGKAE